MELARIEIRAVEERFSKLILEKEEEVRKSRKIAQQNEDVQVYFPKLYSNNFCSNLGLLCQSQIFYFKIVYWKTFQDTNIGELRAQVLELSLNNNQLQKEVANSNEIIQSLRDKAEEDNATSVTEKTNLELTVKALSDKNSSLSETIRKQIEERLIFKR